MSFSGHFVCFVLLKYSKTVNSTYQVCVKFWPCPKTADFVASWLRVVLTHTQWPQLATMCFRGLRRDTFKMCHLNCIHASFMGCYWSKFLKFKLQLSSDYCCVKIKSILGLFWYSNLKLADYNTTFWERPFQIHGNIHYVVFTTIVKYSNMLSFECDLQFFVYSTSFLFLSEFSNFFLQWIYNSFHFYFSKLFTDLLLLNSQSSQ